MSRWRSGAATRSRGAAPARTRSTGWPPAVTRRRCSTSTTCTSRRWPSWDSSALRSLQPARGPARRSGRLRRAPLVATATGAYVAWLVHAAYDWDWELPGVTIVAFLCAGCALAAGRTIAVRATGARRTAPFAAACARRDRRRSRTRREPGARTQLRTTRNAATMPRPSALGAPGAPVRSVVVAAVGAAGGVRLAQGKRRTRLRLPEGGRGRSRRLDTLARARECDARDRAPHAVARLQSLAPAVAQAFTAAARDAVGPTRSRNPEELLRRVYAYVALSSPRPR